jgi:hypothetical protein
MNENVAPALYHFGGRVVELVNQRGDLLTGRRIDVETTPTRIREKVRILIVATKLSRRHDRRRRARRRNIHISDLTLASPIAKFAELGLPFAREQFASEERLSALLISTNVWPNFMNMSIKKLNILILFRQGLHEDEMREFDYVRLHNNG